MKMTLCVLLLIFSFGEIFSQETHGKIVYQLNVVFAENWLRETVTNDQEIDTDSLSLDQIKKNVEKLLENHSCSQIENNTTIREEWTYYFDSIKARVIGNPIFKGETFDIYKINELQRVIRRFHKKDTNDFRIDTIDYKTWKEDNHYTIDVYRNNTVEINGYQCYKVLVREFKKDNNDIVTNYALYITDDINFPPHILLEWNKEIIKGCAVYIKSWLNNSKNTYNEYRMVQFEEIEDHSFFEIPSKFKRK